MTAATTRAANRARRRIAESAASDQRRAEWREATRELDAAERVLRAARQYRDEKRRTVRKLGKGLPR